MTYLNPAAGFPTWTWATSSFFSSGYFEGKSHLRKSEKWEHLGTQVCGTQNSTINYQNTSHQNSWCLFMVHTEHPYMMTEKFPVFSKSWCFIAFPFQDIITLWTQLEQWSSLAHQLEGWSSYFLWGQSVWKAWRVH